VTSVPVPRPRRRASGGRLGRSTAIFAFWTGVSRVAGLAREIVAAAIFGTGGAAAAFVIAFQVPNLLRSLVADSALSAAFVPVFTELDEQGRHGEARRLAGALFGLISAGLGLVTVIAMVTAPWVMPIFAPGLPDDVIPTMVTLSQIMFPIVVLLGLTGLVVGILQAGGQFGPTAFVPVLWNAVILICLVAVTPVVPEDDRIYVYGVGILIGTLAQLLYLLPYLRGRGPFPLSLGLANPYVRRVLVLMLPVTLGLGLINVNASVDAIFATLVSTEAVRAIDAAFRLYILPQGVFSVAISTVLFPTISRLVARGDVDGLRRTIAAGQRQIFFMLLPASAFLLVLSEPIVRLVYEHGEFDAASTSATSEALFYFTLGLAFNGASLLLIRSFFSLQRPWLPTKVALGAMVLNAVLDAVFYKPFGVGGIPLSTSLSSLASFAALAWLLGRELGGLDGEDVVDGFTRSLIASGLLALLSWSVWRVLDDALGRSLAAQIVSLTCAAGAGIVAYGTAAHAMGMPELRALGRLTRPLR
jgi:putative peptidoglycan lipid II flippase